MRHSPSRTFPSASRRQTLQIPLGEDQFLAATTDSEAAPFENPPVRSARDSLRKSTMYNPLLLVQDPQVRRTPLVSSDCPEGSGGSGTATDVYVPGVFGLGRGRSWHAYLLFTMAAPQPFDYTDVATICRIILGLVIYVLVGCSLRLSSSALLSPRPN